MNPFDEFFKNLSNTIHNAAFPEATKLTVSDKNGKPTLTLHWSDNYKTDYVLKREDLNTLLVFCAKAVAK